LDLDLFGGGLGLHGELAIDEYIGRRRGYWSLRGVRDDRGSVCIEDKKELLLAEPNIGRNRSQQNLG
jgi:hypothetical protein